MNKEVKYYRVMPETYQNLANFLARLPYQTVKSIIADLEIHTQAVYAEPERGRIIKDSTSQCLDDPKEEC